MNITNSATGADKELFKKEFTPIVKGFAIILMFFLHLLSPGAIAHPDMIIDLKAGGQFLSSYLALSGNICIGIFAFITGYGWLGSFDRKTWSERIIKPGGVYFSFYIAMFFFCFPVRLICHYYETGEIIRISFYDIIAGLTGYHSKSVYYGWYVYFFALAVLTYKPLKRLCDNMPVKNAFIKVIVVLIASLACRTVCGITFRYIIRNGVLVGIASNYFRWIPVVLIGMITKQSHLFETIDAAVNQKAGKLAKSVEQQAIFRYLLAWSLFFVLYIGKTVVQGLSGNYSNFDSFIMLPFMYALVVMAESIQNKMARKIMIFIGNISTYMWFTHCILRYEPFQSILCYLRLPVLILAGAMVIIMPISYVLWKIELKIVRCNKFINCMKNNGG